MKYMFKKTPTMITKPLSQNKSPETYDRNWWWMVYGKITKGLPPLRRPKLSKKAQEKEDGIKKYMKLIGMGIIGNSNYIGTSLSGSIQEVKSKGKNPFSFFNL